MLALLLQSHCRLDDNDKYNCQYNDNDNYNCQPDQSARKYLRAPTLSGQKCLRDPTLILFCSGIFILGFCGGIATRVPPHMLTFPRLWRWLTLRACVVGAPRVIPGFPFDPLPFPSRVLRTREGKGRGLSVHIRFARRVLEVVYEGSRVWIALRRIFG